MSGIQASGFAGWKRHFENKIVEFMTHAENNVLLFCLTGSGHFLQYKVGRKVIV